MDNETQTKTTSKAGLALVAIIIAIAALMVGGYGASQLTATFLVNNALDKEARDAQRQVKALQYLRVGETDQAIEILESRLDDDLISLDPQEPYEGLNEKTTSNISQAIVDAKAYREEYPRVTKRTHVDDMVKAVFEKARH